MDHKTYPDDKISHSDGCKPSPRPAAKTLASRTSETRIIPDADANHRLLDENELARVQQRPDDIAVPGNLVFDNDLLGQAALILGRIPA
ncbi:hypothetical protein EC9_28390 [Rosistilla ulvae]|uniref:Uncharacterized protein n=1 Tax=Rosistilla ulvae TaxID=1930277 RepID=A0A517M193_9BACT|nr:hypothetical protein EC9_28390 [Rosistilla ulvae]